MVRTAGDGLKSEDSIQKSKMEKRASSKPSKKTSLPEHLLEMVGEETLASRFDKLPQTVTLAGIDEAGYGPTLGPLVVTCSSYSVRSENMKSDLWELLAESITKNPKDKYGKLVVCDSKKVTATGALRTRLELAVLCHLSYRFLDRKFSTVKILIDALGEGASKELSCYPWYENLDIAIPVHTTIDNIERRLPFDFLPMKALGVTFLGARSKIIEAKQFNEEVEKSDNKATVLEGAVASHMKSLARKYHAVLLTVDRLGGRKNYGKFLFETFKAAQKIRCYEETDKVSYYRVEFEDRFLDVKFKVKGDQTSLPCALSSMISKYVRELLVKRINDFFVNLIPNLKTTAGYPEDAIRFLKDITPVLAGRPEWRELLVRSR
ncbi:MAG: hypothetical protein NUW37_06490 [Planctomycetes bacterium]|nr:hypothetical protein [Planctomycetota bacterium]